MKRRIICLLVVLATSFTALLSSCGIIDDLGDRLNSLVGELDSLSGEIEDIESSELLESVGSESINEDTTRIVLYDPSSASLNGGLPYPLENNGYEISPRVGESKTFDIKLIDNEDNVITDYQNYEIISVGMSGKYFMGIYNSNSLIDVPIKESELLVDLNKFENNKAYMDILGSDGTLIRRISTDDYFSASISGNKLVLDVFRSVQNFSFDVGNGMLTRTFKFERNYSESNITQFCNFYVILMETVSGQTYQLNFIPYGPVQ